MLDVYTALHFGRPANDIDDVKEEAVDADVDGHDKSPRRIQCLMCDNVQTVGATPLDFHKHLVERHFRERMLAVVPSIGTTPVGGKPKFACPFPGCSYEHHYKWIIAKHYGIKHRMAKQFYEEVVGLRESEGHESTTLDLKPHPQPGEPAREGPPPPVLLAQAPPHFHESQLTEPLPGPAARLPQLPEKAVTLPPPVQHPFNQNFGAPQHLNPPSQPQTQVQFQPPTMQTQQQLSQQLHVVPPQRPPAAVLQLSAQAGAARMAGDPVATSAPLAARVDPAARLKDTDDDDDDEEEDDLDELDDTFGLSASESDPAPHFGASSLEAR
jgi:hypothetical protein